VKFLSARKKGGHENVHPSHSRWGRFRGLESYSRVGEDYQVSDPETIAGTTGKGLNAGTKKRSENDEN